MKAGGPAMWFNCELMAMWVMRELVAEAGASR
jgi:hypothetical protein